MLRNVLLRDRYALGLIRAAKAEQYITLAEPETPAERRQLSSFKAELRCAPVTAALRYSLFADQVCLDGSTMWHLYHHDYSDSEPDTISYRDIIASVSDDFSESVCRVDSSENSMYSIRHFLNVEEAARTLAAVEPLVWSSFRRTKPDLTRSDLRIALNLIALNPEIIAVHGYLDSRAFKSVVRETISRLGRRSALLQENAHYWEAICYLSITKGMVALNVLRQAEELRAIVPVPVSLGARMSATEIDISSMIAHRNLVAGVTLLLKEFKHWPQVTRFSQVLAIRRNRHFSEFRELLRRWIVAFTTADEDTIWRLRGEVYRANKALPRIMTCETWGRFFTYVGLPLLFVDAFLIPVFGASATIAGFGVQGYADWQKSKYGWALVGR